MSSLLSLAFLMEIEEMGSGNRVIQLGSPTKGPQKALTCPVSADSPNFQS